MNNLWKEELVRQGEQIVAGVTTQGGIRGENESPNDS